MTAIAPARDQIGSSPTLSAPPTSGRLGYIDNLRIALTVLVIAHHCAVLFLNHDAIPDSGLLAGALSIFTEINQMYFMGFFLLISGYFAPRSLDRKGSAVFIRDRLTRLGIPLLAFVALVSLLALSPFAAGGPDGGQDWIRVGNVGHMWFVELLLALSIGYTLLHRLLPRRAPVPRTAAPVTMIMIVGLVGALTALTLGWRLVVPLGTTWPVVGFPSAGYLPQYVVLFALGAMAARRQWLASLSIRHGQAGAAMAVAGLPVGLLHDSSHGFLQAIGVLGEQFAAVGMIIGLLVLFRHRCHAQPQWAEFAAENAFAVYIIHTTVIGVIGMLLLGVGMLDGLTLVILFGLTVPTCWQLAHRLRRIPAVARIL